MNCEKRIEKKKTIENEEKSYKCEARWQKKNNFILYILGILLIISIS